MTTQHTDLSIMLQREYQGHLSNFKKDKICIHPSYLLALLILKDKNKYISKDGDGQSFYEHYKEDIDNKIKQVMSDFSISEDQLYNFYQSGQNSIGLSNTEEELTNPKVREAVFGPVLSIIATSLWLSPNLSSKIVYDIIIKLYSSERLTLDDIEKEFILPQTPYNTKEQKNIMPSLKEQYNHYLDLFNKTGKHPHPAELVSLLLSVEKDKYPPINTGGCDFLLYYRDKVNMVIEKVCIDFGITKSEIIEYIRNEHYLEVEDAEYENYKLSYVFLEGFDGVHWANIYHPTWSPKLVHETWRRRNWKKGKIGPIKINETKPKAPFISSISLSDTYINYIKTYNETGVLPNLNIIIALLLLDNKDKFYKDRQQEEPKDFASFCKQNQDLIESMIQKIIADFNITDSQLNILYLKIIPKGMKNQPDDTPKEKIWYIFLRGILEAFWANAQNPSWTKEMIFSSLFKQTNFYRDEYVTTISTEKFGVQSDRLIKGLILAHRLNKESPKLPLDYLYQQSFALLEESIPEEKVVVTLINQKPHHKPYCRTHKKGHRLQGAKE